MKKIAFGLFFIMFNFDINQGAYSIGLIPNFIGYICLINAFDALPTDKTQCFCKSKKLSKVMIPLEIIFYALNIFGFFAEHPVLKYFAGMVSAVAMLLITYYIAVELIAFESECNYSFIKKGLMKTWKCLSVIYAVYFVIAGVPIINMISYAAVIIVNFCYLSLLNEIKKSYCLYTPGGAGAGW